MLVRYEELSLKKLLEIVKFFGVTPTAHVESVIERISMLYSKDPIPSRLFADDSEEKRVAATLHAHEMATAWALKPFQRLNEIYEARTCTSFIKG